MKWVLLIKARLSQYLKTNRTIFLLFLAGGILSSTVFSYFYGNLVSIMSTRNLQDTYYRKYTVTFWEPVNQEMVDALLDSELVESVSVMSDFFDKNQELQRTIVAEMKNHPSAVISKGTRNPHISVAEIIIPPDATEMVGEWVMLQGREFLAIGQHTESFYYISFQDFQDMNLPIQGLQVIAKERQNFSNDRIVCLVQEIFPASDISTPEQFENMDTKNALGEILMICFVYAVSMMSFVFLLAYLLDSNLDHTMICRLVGASNRDIFRLTLLEGVSLCVLVDAGGLLLHRLLYAPLFRKINISTELVYSLGDYLTIFLLMLGVGLCVVLPFIHRYARLTPTSARCRAEG